MTPPPRPGLLARSQAADRLNGWLAKAWAKGTLPPPVLTPEALWKAGSKGFDPADEVGGRSAADVADFRDRLTRLTHALKTEAELNALGQAFAYGQITRAIRSRHGVGRVWRKRPDVAQTPLAPPIVVLGQMRSGTTRIHRLLAADPAFAATRFCDSWNPVPRRPDLRPLNAAAMLKTTGMLNPWMQSIHPTGATRADEELGWLASALGHSTYWAQWRVPSFTADSETRDPAPLYAEFDRIFRTDAAHNGNAGQMRVLKVPQFSDHPAELLRRYPDARVIHCRRDESEVIRSAASLLANQMGMQSDTADLAEIEREVTRKVRLREARTRDALAAFDGAQTSVSFDAMNADWKGLIAAIYRDLGLSLTAEAERCMTAEARRAEKGAHTHHRH